MFGLHKGSSKKKFQREANFKSSSQNSLNVFDDFVPVQERLAQRRPHKMPNRRCKEQFKTSKGEADPKRKHFQFDVQQFCDNFVKGVDKALKDVSKSQKKSTPTRAPVAEPSIFISEKPKEMMESWITCEDECDLPSPKPDLMFDIDNEETNGLTCFEPEHPSSLVLVSQVFEEEPLDYPQQVPCLDTRRPMDVDLYPIFDEEDDHFDELGPTFDEKPLSITSIIMENRLCFDPGTTPTPLSKENCKELCIISFVPDLFDKVSSNDIKLSFLDHLEKSCGLDLQQLVFCSRKSFDSFVFKENRFTLRSYGHELITAIFFASSYALYDFIVSTLLEQNSNKAETDFCGDSVLKPVHSYSESDFELKLLCSESDQVRHVLEMFYGSSFLENILIYNTFFDKHAEPWIRNSQFELNLLCSKSEKLAHVLNLFFRNCAIMCPDTILVYNTDFDRLHDDLKRVLHVLGKETLVFDLNKYLSCTYDPGILIFVLKVQDKQDQSPKGVRNRSRDRAYQFEIWRCMYSRKPTSKLQGIKIYVHCLTHIFQTTRLLRMKSLRECSQLNYESSSKKNQIKQSSYVTVMPFVNQEIFNSHEFRPPKKLEMANLLYDEPKTNSIMPKVIIHVLNVQEILGHDGFQKDSKIDLSRPNGETDQILAKGKDGFRPGLKGTCLGPYQEHILQFSKSWSWLYQEAVQVSVKDFM
ncbi:hypothetical protein DY000_02014974 [Brassica cretica]|uniref:FBD domain-containing protein n=1 Tax=Brassica cretica TaxID=69181 RepID=A0ABQ7CZG0_BRACR|nr:hypothetical protein DY000_02014974 [Brassica cretica]